MIWFALYITEDGKLFPSLIPDISEFSKAFAYARRMKGPYTLAGVVSSEVVDTLF